MLENIQRIKSTADVESENRLKADVVKIKKKKKKILSKTFEKFYSK